MIGFLGGFLLGAVVGAVTTIVVTVIKINRDLDQPDEWDLGWGDEDDG